MLDKSKRYLIVGLGLLGGKYALELTRAGYTVDGIVEIDDLFRRLHAAGGFIFHLKPVLSSDKIRAKRPGYSLLTLSCRGCQPHAHRATLYLYPSIPTVSI